MFWIMLIGSKTNPEIIVGDMEYQHSNNRLYVYDRIEDARERKAMIKKKYPELEVWIVEISYE